MPCLSGSFNPAVGPLINLGVAPLGTLGHGAPSSGSPAVFSALLDTGAAVTCISPAVARAVGLQPIGLRPTLIEGELIWQDPHAK